MRHGAARLGRVRHGLARVGSPLVKTARAASTGCLCASRGVARRRLRRGVGRGHARHRAAAASDEGDGAARQGPHRGRRDGADDERAVRGRRAGADHRRLVADAGRLPRRVRQGRSQVGHGAERRRQLPYRERQHDVHRNGDPAARRRGEAGPERAGKDLSARAGEALPADRDAYRRAAPRHAERAAQSTPIRSRSSFPRPRAGRGPRTS